MHSQSIRDASSCDATQGLRWSAPQQKHIAYALQAHPSAVCRMLQGQPSFITRTHEAVRQLVRENPTEAGQLLWAFMLTAEDEACKLPEAELRRRFLEACAQETVEQAAEDVATHHAVVAMLTGEGEREALEAQDEALRKEGGRHVDALIYNRAYRVLRGWRARA